MKFEITLIKSETSLAALIDNEISERINKITFKENMKIKIVNP